MQQAQLTLPLWTIIAGRYSIEGILGKGGFSAVYLVKDQHDGQLFALKELIDQDEEERVRFEFEGEVLERLDHYALPHVHQIFEDGDRAYMLMDYIEGPNLEALRKQQPGKRFSLSHLMTIMAPIVEAVAYLHAQQPPLIHRDIKPANIIVPKNGAAAMLVDFGIVKEYYVDSTTTAIRHLSPGYGAPEQYSGLGTDLRTDIYSLGATCYALLTGTLPTDAFRRATKLASMSSDPLPPINELASDVPPEAAEAIHRAMSIGNEERFSQVGEFWQAMHEHAAKEAPFSEDSRPTSSSSQKASLRALSTRKRSVALLIGLTLLLLLTAGLSFSFYALHDDHLNPAMSASILPRKANPHPTSTPTSASSIYPHIAQSYEGTLRDLLTNSTMHISFTRIQQSRETITGYFSEPQQINRTFTGVLDTSQHIFLTVAGSSRHAPLFFEGSVRPGGYLVGNYCNIDQAGQCIGSYGIWSLTSTP